MKHAGLLLFLCLCCYSQPLRVSKIDVADPAFKSRIGGFYPSGQGWLWTSEEFSIMLDPPPIKGEVWLTLDFTVPIELISQVHSVTITGRVNGTVVGSQEYRKADHVAISWGSRRPLLRKGLRAWSSRWTRWGREKMGNLSV